MTIQMLLCCKILSFEFPHINWTLNWTTIQYPLVSPQGPPCILLPTSSRPVYKRGDDQLLCTHTNLHGRKRCEDLRDLDEVETRAYIRILILAGFTQKMKQHVTHWMKSQDLPYFMQQSHSTSRLRFALTFDLMTGSPAWDALGTISLLYFASYGKSGWLTIPSCCIERMFWISTIRPSSLPNTAVKSGSPMMRQPQMPPDLQGKHPPVAGKLTREWGSHSNWHWGSKDTLSLLKRNNNANKMVVAVTSTDLQWSFLKIRLY